MAFGPAPVTDLTAITIDSTTLFPCSKAGAQNEIPWSEVLLGIAGNANNFTAAQTITLSSANAYAFGPNGNTNPVLRVITNVASQADGISVSGGAAGAGTTIAALSSGSNSPIILTPKGTGTVNVPTITAVASSTANLIVSTAGNGLGAYFSGGTQPAMYVGGTAVVGWFAGTYQLTSGVVVAWTTGTIGSGNDTGFARNAAGVVEVNNGTAGTFRAIKVGNTSTSLPAMVQVGIASRATALTNYQTSAAGSLGNVSGGAVFDILAPTSTTHTDGTFDTLGTYTSVANALIVNGDSLVFDYTLTVVGHAVTTSNVKIAFGGITIFNSGALALGTGTSTIRLRGYISRVSSTTCVASVAWDVSGGSGIVLASADIQQFTGTGTLTGLTLLGTNDLVLSAASASTNAASGDIAVVHGKGSIQGFGS